MLHHSRKVIFLCEIGDKWSDRWPDLLRFQKECVEYHDYIRNKCLKFVIRHVYANYLSFIGGRVKGKRINTHIKISNFNLKIFSRNYFNSQVYCKWLIIHDRIQGRFLFLIILCLLYIHILIISEIDNY